MDIIDRNLCPTNAIGSFLKIIGKKWMLVIIFELFFNKRHFNDLKREFPELDNKTLSLRLKELQNHGFVEKREKNGRSEYYLTDKGKSLNKIIFELSIWAIKDSSILSDEEKDRIYLGLNQYILGEK